MKLLIVDASPPRKWWEIWRADLWFQAGSFVADAVDFDVVERVTTGEQAMRAIAKHRPDHVQIWGHGAPGLPVIGHDALRASDTRWQGCRTVWFRSCSVAQGERGRAFMNQIAAYGTNVVAHAAQISGFAQSYLVGVEAKQKAWWPARLKPKGSSLTAPRTVLPTDLSLPHWAFQRVGL